MALKPSDALKLAIALVLLLIAAVGIVRFLASGRTVGGQSYFYDLGAQKLFVAPHESIPPIQGSVGLELDGVRAVVISRTGQSADKEVAYLETYTPELKRLLEARRKGVEAPDVPSINRSQAQDFTLVKRPGEKDWHPLSSSEGQAILSSVLQPSPNGVVPTICVP